METDPKMGFGTGFSLGFLTLRALSLMVVGEFWFVLIDKDLLVPIISLFNSQVWSLGNKQTKTNQNNQKNQQRMNTGREWITN